MPFDDQYSGRVIGLATEVHSILGPGLAATIYEECLCRELTDAGIPFQRHAEIPMVYEGHTLPVTFQADILVGDDLVVGIVAVDVVEYEHEAAVRTWLRFSGRRIGFLFNFNTVDLEEGMRRYDM